MKEKLKLLSLFSGIGAFEKGLNNLDVDYELVGYSEFDKHASKSYQLIHNVSEELNLGDITKIDEKELPYFDLMTYGFPCQAFSVQGKRLGFNDEEKGNLFFESMRIAKEKKPKYMIAENVKGLLSHDKGKTFKTIINTLEYLGYNNYYKLLNSAYFDIPQSRERIYIVSIRKDVDNGEFKFPEGELTTLQVADFIDKEISTRHIKGSLKPYLNDAYHKEYKGKNNIRKIFDGNTQGYFNSNFSGKRIYSIYGVSPTLTTNSSDTNFYEIGGEPNAKERFRLQGFSDEDYEKVKNHITESQLKKQAGNSITVNVIEKILESLLVSQGEIHTYF